MEKNLFDENENQPGEIDSEDKARAFATGTLEFKDPYSDNIYKPEIEEKAVFQTNFKPESSAETNRKSGLAYAAGITLVGAVVVMLLVGWFVDRLAGTSPWGIVGGIILGSVIGFYQFFKLTSQILKNKE
jgi:ATP synthase protein I